MLKLGSGLQHRKQMMYRLPPSKVHAGRASFPASGDVGILMTGLNPTGGWTPCRNMSCRASFLEHVFRMQSRPDHERGRKVRRSLPPFHPADLTKFWYLSIKPSRFICLYLNEQVCIVQHKSIMLHRCDSRPWSNKLMSVGSDSGNFSCTLLN